MQIKHISHYLFGRETRTYHQKQKWVVKQDFYRILKYNVGMKQVEKFRHKNLTREGAGGATLCRHPKKRVMLFAFFLVFRFFVIVCGFCYVFITRRCRRSVGGWDLIHRRVSRCDVPATRHACGTRRAARHTSRLKACQQCILLQPSFNDFVLFSLTFYPRPQIRAVYSA